MCLYNKYFDEENMFSDLYRSVDYDDCSATSEAEEVACCGREQPDRKKGLPGGFGFDGLSSLSILLLLLLLMDGEDDEKLIIIILALVFGI